MRSLKIQLNSEEISSSINKFSLIIAVFFAGIAGYAYFAFLPFYLASPSIGFSPGQITFVFTFMGVGMAISSWFFGRIRDKTGRRKILFISALVLQKAEILLVFSNQVLRSLLLPFGIILRIRTHR